MAIWTKSEGTVEAKREVVAQLHALELSLDHERAEVARTAMRADVDAGRSLVDDRLAGRETSGETQAAVAAAWDRVATLSQAIVEARERRQAAIREVWRAEAAGLTQRADTLDAEADERSKTTERLLRELAEFEGVQYVPTRAPDSQPVRHLDVGTPLGALQVTTVTVPRTQSLRNEASQLRRQATQVEARHVKTGGTLRAGTREDLIVAVESYDPMVIAPLPSTVDVWAQEAEATLRERVRRTDVLRADAPFDGYVVQWHDGQINAAVSSISLASN